MNYMPFSINHNVAVVTIFDLENVARDRVRCHRLDEIQPRLLEGSGVLASVFGNEEV